MATTPAACPPGGGGGDAADVESHVFCVTDENGERIATVVREYEYDEDGQPVGDPRLVDAATGDEYTPPAGATVGPCEDSGCGAPKTFCFSSTETNDEQGRSYDLTLNHAQGFEVESLIIDLIEYPLGISWDILDIDASEFVQELQQGIQSQFRGDRAATVTVTPPAALAANGTCGEREPFQIHIECIALTDEPPTLVQVTHNAGQDMIQNPAYNEVGGPLNELCGNGDEADQGGSWRAPRRVDDGGTLRCTDVAGRGWESNDAGTGDGPRFEVWCNPGFTSANNVTPTPRGTPVQEINAFGASNNPGDGVNNGQPDTIWQTFVAPASGPFTIEAVVGGRGVTEQFQISLTVGDTDDNQIGDVLFDSIDAPNVLNRANPWTVYERTANLNAGQTYTLALRGPINTPPNATGGLFTDLRAYQDLPGERENFVNDDDSCTVSKTTTSITSAEWTPICGSGGNNPGIVSWRRASDGMELTNAAFWAQEPAPTDCNTARADAESAVGNLTHTYAVCMEVNGNRRTGQRVVVADQSGGVIQSQILDTDGSPVTPDTWQPGICGTERDVEEQPVCVDGITMIRRVQFIDGQPQPATYLGPNGENVDPAPTAFAFGTCSPGTGIDDECLVDDNGVYFRRVTTTLDDDGTTTVTVTTVDVAGNPYVVVGQSRPCEADDADIDVEETEVCADGTTLIMRTVHRDGVEQARVFLGANGLPVAAPADYAMGACPCVPINFGEGCYISATAQRRRFVRILECDGTVTFRDSALGEDVTDYINANGVANCTTEHVESAVLCDLQPDGTSIPFVRLYSLSGTQVDDPPLTRDVLLDGVTPYGPTGTVSRCPDLDVEETLVCATVTGAATNPNQIQRRAIYRDAVLVSETFWLGQTDLTGTVADWTPGACATSDVEVTDGCLTLAGGGTAAGQQVTVYDSAGVAQSQTLRRIDGGAVAAGDTFAIGPCPRTLNTQARFVTPGNDWTPAEVTAGTRLTSVTLTVIIGSASITDFNGTVTTPLPAGMNASWSSEDGNTLTGPQTIAANAGGQVFVSWTEAQP